MLIICFVFEEVSIYAKESVSFSAESEKPLVYVDPPEVRNLAVGKTFTISVKIANVTNLYGVDIEFHWNPTILEYMEHTVLIPVDDYPGGVLYKPIMPIANTVNATGGTYKVAYASMLPAPSFDGSGTVFTMKFKVKSIGRSLLDIYTSDLSGKVPPGPLIIYHDVQDGYFSNYVPSKAKIYINPPKIIDSTLTPTSNFTVNVNLENVVEFDTFEFWINYNTTILDAFNVTVNPTFPAAQTNLQIMEAEGKIRTKAWLQPASPPYTGNLMLASIIFKVADIGASTLDLYNITLVDAWKENIPYQEPGDGFFSNMLLTKLFIDPSEIIDPTIRPPMTFNIYVKAENVMDMYGYEFKLSYDTNVLTALGVRILPPTNDTSFTVTTSIDDPSGYIWIKVQYYPPAVPITITSAKALVELLFQVQSLGVTVLDLHDERLTDVNGNQIRVDEVGDGFFMSIIRNVAILNATATPNKVYPGRMVTITVLVKNLGIGMSETFNVTVYYDNNPIATQIVADLAPQHETTLTFLWDTTGLQPCNNYTIRAEASQVPFEVNLEDNIYFDGWVKIKIWGDVDGDGDVDIYDIALASAAYGSRPGDPNWNPEADVAPEWGFINIYDMVTISSYYGQTC